MSAHVNEELQNAVIVRLAPSHPRGGWSVWFCRAKESRYV